MAFFNKDIETLPRKQLEELVEARIHYTVRYAYENSPFYKNWFQKNHVSPSEIETHLDLLKLPIVSGKTIRKNQPPASRDFQFKSVDWNQVFTINETSGTSGSPKAFFLSWNDWERYADKYARAFVSQGFGAGDRIVVCASYGMNIGANTMTLAANKIGMTIIPEGKCVFPPHVILNYKPTGLVGSVFKFLRLARQMLKDNMCPSDSGVKRLVIGGESFAEEARAYLSEIWGCRIFNTYGSTEGTMCGECSQISGLHVPEDLVHLDVYDPGSRKFVEDGECGRLILSTLLPTGEKSGMILLNYDTEDTAVVISRDKCDCGRTHTRISNPQRESETVWIEGSPVNRVDFERGVFQRENMEYITGEYEVLLQEESNQKKTIAKISLETLGDSDYFDSVVEEAFLKGFFKYKPKLEELYSKERFRILLDFLPPKHLHIYKSKGRPTRIIDQRKAT